MKLVCILKVCSHLTLVIKDRLRNKMEEDTGASSGTLKSSKKPKGCGGFSAFHCVTLHLGHNLHGLIKAERETNNLSVQLNNILISEMCSSSLCR